MRWQMGLGAAVVAGAAALSVLSVASYLADQALFREEASRVTQGASGPDEQALALLHFVHHHHGFAKNKGYYLLKMLGPTARQVYESGGDCADKSRLLSAMLRAIDVPSTLAMCFDHDGAPTHTVVDAALPGGGKMLLDPIWDLYFPRPEAHQYYSLIDLRRHPELLFERLAVVTASAAADAKIRRYNRAHDIYDHATTLNWEKSSLMRALKARAFGDLGDQVYAVPRPLLLEEPKLFVAAAAGGAAVALGAVLALLAAWRARRGKARVRVTPPTGT